MHAVKTGVTLENMLTKPSESLKRTVYYAIKHVKISKSIKWFRNKILIETNRPRGKCISFTKKAKNCSFRTNFF